MLAINILLASILSSVAYSRVFHRQFNNGTNSTIPDPVNGTTPIIPGIPSNNTGTGQTVTINLFANSFNSSGKQVQHAINVPADGQFHCLSDLACSSIDASGVLSPTNPATGPDSFCAADKTAAVSVTQDVSNCVVFAPTSDRKVMKITAPGQKFFFGRYAAIASACCGDNCELNGVSPQKSAVNGTNSCAPRPRARVVRLEARTLHV